MFMPRHPRRPLIAGLAAAALIPLLIGSPPAAALTDDENQPLYIESDAAELDDLQSLSFYIGNVDVQQGSMQILADEIVVHHRPDRQIDKIIAIGQPVRYRQLLDGDPVPVEGEALRAEWDAARAELTLIDQAILIQGGDKFASDRIVYNRTTARVTAGGSARGRERVKIRIVPEGADGQPAAASSAPAPSAPSPAPAGAPPAAPRTRTMVEPVAPTANAPTTPPATPPATPTPPATLTAIRPPVPSALPTARATAPPASTDAQGPTLPAGAARAAKPAPAATPTPAPSPFLDPP